MVLKQDFTTLLSCLSKDKSLSNITPNCRIKESNTVVINECPLDHYGFPQRSRNKTRIFVSV